MTKVNSNYGAISIDSNIFFRYGYKLKNSVISQLQQFKGGGIKVVQSDVVHRECLSHIVEKYEGYEQNIKKSIREINKYSEENSDEIERVLGEIAPLIEPSEKALTKLSSFYDDVGMEIIESNEHVELESIVDMYFNFIPPFEKNEKKRYEFPDAIALKSLESWAKKNDTKILAVSDDKGWAAFAEGNDSIDVINDLAQAMNHLLPQHRMIEMVSLIRENNILDEEELADFFAKDLYETDLYSLDLISSSSFAFEIDDIYAEMDFCLIDKDDDGKIKIVALNIDGNKMTANIMANISINLDLCIDFQKLDPVDKDLVSVSVESVNVTTNYYAEAIVEIILPDEDEAPSKDNVDIVLIDVKSDLKYLYLGDLEPSFAI